MSRTKFGLNLSRNNDQISNDRAIKWTARAKAAAHVIVLESQDRVDTIQEKIDNLTDISTSNDLQTANRVGQFDGKRLMNELFSLKRELKIAEDELSMDQETEAEYFGDTEQKAEETTA